MKLNKLDNLIELFFHQAQKQKSNSIFLEWINSKNNKSLTWSETEVAIWRFNKILKQYVKEGDRCLLISENRPEWLIADIAIMLSGAITVPAYTTYTESDYKYLIEDC